MEKKNKTAKVTKTKERRITNKKVESLHKYWEAFPGLKKRLIIPVEGENYSLIKPKNVDKAVRAYASVKRAKEYVSAVSTSIGESLIFSLRHNAEECNLEVLKGNLKREARKITTDIPFFKWRSVYSAIDLYWPLAEEYQKTSKEGGIKALMKHPLFFSAAKFFLANKMEKEESLKLFLCSAIVDLFFEKAKYVPVSDGELELNKKLKEMNLSHEEEWKLTDEEITAKVNRHIDDLNEDEVNKIINLAFFVEIRTCIEPEFYIPLYHFIKKLSA